MPYLPAHPWFSDARFSVPCVSTASKWLSAVGLTVAVDVQSVRAAANFSGVASTVHVALGVSVWSDSSTVGEAVAAV